jgi:hypothetical protein
LSRSTVDFIMRLKTLRKKIRRLEARLQKGATKLAKLKQKLEATATAAAAKAKRKSAARAGRARRRIKDSAQTQNKKGRLTAKAPVRSAGAKSPSAARNVKRKLNLSPERRAQLAAAMKARWAAKRAAAEAESPKQLSAADSDHTG